MEMPLIRSPRPDDVDGIAGLLGELGYPSAPASVSQRLAELARQGHIAVFVAEVDGRPVGLATAYIVPAIHVDRPVGVLSALVVQEGHRRRGLGRELVAAAEAWARDRNAYRMTLSTGLARQEAHAFYEGLGYEHTSRRYSRLL
jgi:GNAT superfamily N-acetyltransferase